MKTFKTRALWYIGLIITSMALVIYLALTYFLNNFIHSQTEKSLEKDLAYCKLYLGENSKDTFDKSTKSISELGAKLNLRVTVIGINGELYGDSHLLEREKNTYLNEEEFQEALNKGQGKKIRYSDVFKQNTLYLAETMKSQDGKTHAIIRVGMPLGQTASIENNLMLQVILGIGSGLLAGLILSFWLVPRLILPLAKLKKILPSENEKTKTTDEIEEITNNYNNLLIELTKKNKLLKEHNQTFEQIMEEKTKQFTLSQEELKTKAEKIEKEKDALESKIKSLSFNLNQSAEKLNKIYEIGSLINYKLDLDDAFKVILETIVNTMGLPYCSIKLLNHENNDLLLMSEKGKDPEYVHKLSKIGLNLKLDNPEEIIKRKIIYFNDVTDREDLTAEGKIIVPEEIKEYLQKKNLGGLFTALLVIKQKVYGTLNIIVERNYLFTKEDLRLLTTFAEQAAIAIKNTQTTEQKSKTYEEFTDHATLLKKQLNKITVLHEISQALYKKEDLNELIPFILDQMLKAVNTAKGSIMLLNDDTLVLKAIRGEGIFTEVREKPLFKIGEGIAGKVAETGKAIITNQPIEDPLFLKRDNNPHDLSIRNLLCVPMISNGKVIGIINMSNKKDTQDFDDNDFELIQYLAGEIASLIDLSRLHQLVVKDKITRFYIKDYFSLLLDKEILRSDQYGLQFSFILLEVDNWLELKGKNEKDLLSELASLIKETIRYNIDLAAYYGEGVFALILPEQTTKQAYLLAERLQNKIEQSTLSSQTITTTMSIVTYPATSKNKSELMEKAYQTIRDKHNTSKITLV